MIFLQGSLGLLSGIHLGIHSRASSCCAASAVPGPRTQDCASHWSSARTHSDVVGSRQVDPGRWRDHWATADCPNHSRGRSLLEVHSAEEPSVAVVEEEDWVSFHGLAAGSRVPYLVLNQLVAWWPEKYAAGARPDRAREGSGSRGLCQGWGDCSCSAFSLG
jgi:hypothetical protein